MKLDLKNVKQIVTIICSAIILGGGAWYAMEIVMEDQPLSSESSPLPTASLPQPTAVEAKTEVVAEGETDAEMQVETDSDYPPSAVVEKSPGQLIDEIVTASGLHKQIREIPDKIMMGAKQSSAMPRDPDAVKQVEKIMTESFKPEHFHQRIRKALLKDFDHDRIAGLLKSYHSPLVRKMQAFEQRDIQSDAFESFMDGLADAPLSEERFRLVRKYDSATNITDFAVELVAGTTRAMMMGATSGDMNKMTAFDADFAKHRKDLTDTMRNVMLVTLVYVYREASDAELAEYVDFFTSEDSKWFETLSMATLLEEFHAGAQFAGERLAALTQTKHASADESALTTVDVQHNDTAPDTPRKTRTPTLTARSNLDARMCLNLASNVEIQRCAEDFR
ncbi:MAG: hypothetical protein MRK00_07055 [Nitrosomonas sp.]|nr:hypothetical protein [Nitrosomonas sp.]